MANEYMFYVRGPNSAKLKEYDHEGATYIEGRKGSEYTLYFFNNTNYSVEVVFSVDGLSVVDGKPAGVNSKGYVVRGYSTIEVPGWYINASTVGKFVFQPQGDSRDLTYVEALKADGIQVDAGNQGVIGCLVFTEKFDGRALYRTLSMNSAALDGYNSGEFRSRGISAASSDRRINTSHYGSFSKGGPSNEVKTSGGILKSQGDAWGAGEYEATAGLGTGMGADQSYNTRKVTFKRATPSVPVYTRVITYDTLRGLRKRGVPVDIINPLSNAFPASPQLSSGGCRIPSNRGRG